MTNALISHLSRGLFLPIVAFALIGTGCGNKAETGDSSATGGSNVTATDGLSPDQLLNGIGPVRSVTLAAIDAKLAEAGEELFSLKCSMCHKTEERYIGPPLKDVLETRTPAYVMNMILNPEEMVQKHPEAKKMLAEYSAPMANQSLTESEARSILEYLRTLKD